MPEVIIAHTGEVGCQCGGCNTGGVNLDASVDNQAGAIIAGKTVWSVAQIETYLNRSGTGWNGLPGQAVQSDTNLAEIKFGFHTSQASLQANGYVFSYQGGNYGMAEYFNFTPFSAAQQATARVAMGLWDDLVAVTFTESTINAADIAFGNLTSAPTTQAYAYLPGGPIYNIASINLQVRDVHGDVWISLSAASNLQMGFGQYGLATQIHEIGHALGVSHPGGYNAAPGVSITYAANAEYYQDTRQYSQMSYFNAEFSGGGHIDWNKVGWVYGQTPLLHDIAAIQKMYGADLTTRTGDTVYGFNSTAGKDVYNFALNTMPVLAIYDAGGVDTLDLSGFAGGNKIDLNPGAFSSAGGSGVIPLDVLKAKGLLAASYTEAQYEALRARYNAPDGMLKDNIAIAYGTIVENAVGGAGNDVIVGNAVANILSGLAGMDVITGGAGDDTLDGGLGADTLNGGIGGDFYLVDDGGDQVVELAGEGSDTVSSGISYTLTANVENLVLTGSALSGTGNGLANVITGNDLANLLSGGEGDDTLIGNGGNDVLDGGLGADAMSGGTGDDLYFVDTSGDVVIELGGEGSDTVSSAITYTLGDNVENLILTGAAATGTGNGLDNLLTGNALSNRLDGGAGNDRLSGGDGVDYLTGGAGSDVFVGEINATPVAGKGGPISLDVVLDFVSGSDRIDLSGIDANRGLAGDQAFTLVNGATPRNAGEISIRNFGNVNAAENALGFDIDGVDGDSPFAGPVRVVLGNVDGGEADFAMVFIGGPEILVGDFVL
ncbi:MAG TPA: M10 family metallopeptidase C-terminal domain-containing protein [Allosphingosinicella sp.]|nr:M10 family metallopeptidase C-terminal domain-containing protein [Allosphingosinicella sp.]